jgi:cobaltochelatase CobN
MRNDNVRPGAGWRAKRLVFLSLLPFLLTPSILAAEPVHLAFLYSDGNIPGTVRAYKALLDERPDLKGQVSISFLTESVFEDVDPAGFTRADVLVMDIMNQQMLDRFNEKHKVDLIKSVRSRGGKVLAIGEGLLPKENYIEQGAVWEDLPRAYWKYSGFANQLALIKYGLMEGGVTGLTIPDPQPSLDFGYYYPDGKAGQVFPAWEQFDAWRQAQGKRRPGAPRVAVGFYKSSYYSGETQLLDAVIAEIEKQGAEAIPVFGYPGSITFERLLIDSEGRRRADVALGFLFRFADFEASKSLAKVDIPVINMISLYGRTEKEWRESNQGISLFEGTFQVAVPEIAGTIAPMIVGSQEKVKDAETGLTMVVRRPIASRVSMAVQRGLKYAALRAKPNFEKHMALVFYNYPPGKANIGASYLNVADSLANILQRLKAEGYDVGDAEISSANVLKDITEKARNVGGYASGELQEMVNQGGAVRVSVADYKKWLNQIAPGLRSKIIKDWGAPEKNRLMALDGPGGPSIIIPAVQYGNIALLPQPARGWGEDVEKMYHAKDLAPHHQYVATYAWLRNGFKADAVVHIGTHGTLEWLDGKDIGLSENDAPDALISDMPDFYIYNVDVVGEGLVARRRGMATLIDHMVPPFKQGGLYPELAKLSETISDHEANESKNTELAAAYLEKIREQVIGLGIAKTLGLDLSKPDSLDEETLHLIENHLIELKGQNIPFGLHAFGRTPEKELRDSTIQAIVSADRSSLPTNAKVLAEEMEERITASGPRELDSLMHAAGGGYVLGGNGGEPIRNPDVYPTGKNFYGIDPDKVPKKASWEIGVKLADQMLADHVKKNGRYPEKVSFVIWGDETMRHEGILESQIFHLLGTRPVWNGYDKVVDVDIIPAAQLGRPRVDIIIASSAAGMFNNVTLLIDKAVQQVKAMDEAENYVRRHYLNTKALLIEKGYSDADADRRAGVRIFDEPPGIYNLNTSDIAAASGTWDTDKGMADDYIRKLGHGYGNGFWGESMEDVFRLALAGTEKVVHSSSTSLYGALDNDDFFMYMGGLAAAVRSIDGKTPEMVVTNTRDPGKPEMTSIDKFIGTEFQSRYVNPTWIEGMKKEGYAGAGEMRSFVEYLWGWDAVTPEVVDDGMWEETFDVYVQDKHNLGMKNFFEKASPFAYQDMFARMAETVRKGYWNADSETQKKLISEYVDSVNRHGASGAEHTTGNARLSKFVMERGKELGIPVPALEGFRQVMEKAMGGSVAKAAESMENFVSRNEAPSNATDSQQSQPITRNNVPSDAAGALQGYLMSVAEREQAAKNQTTGFITSGQWDSLYVTLPILAFLFAWRRQRRYL